MYASCEEGGGTRKKDWDCVFQEPAVTGTDFYTWKMLNYRSFELKLWRSH